MPKPMILLRMIDWDKEFDHLTARVIFGRNDLTLSWLIGQPLPPTLVEDILKTIFGDGFVGAVSSPTGGSANAPTFAQCEATVPFEVPELPETVTGRDEIIAEVKHHLGATDTAAADDANADADADANANADADAAADATAALVKGYESKEGFDPTQPAVVVVGMGGSGKTVLGASIARDPTVAKTFEKILFVTLGKLPDVSKLQGDARYSHITRSLHAHYSLIRFICRRHLPPADRRAVPGRVQGDWAQTAHRGRQGGQGRAVFGRLLGREEREVLSLPRHRQRQPLFHLHARAEPPQTASD